MPSRRISFTNFNRRLVLAGGREQMANPNGLRRASGVAQELTDSVVSRWGSIALYPINAIQLYYWNGHRYQYDGANLYEDGVSIMGGFNGSRLSFNSMPPQEGLQDYLFVLGGGATPFKVAPNGVITNWGIVAPPNQMGAANVANDQIVIDSFVASSANYTATNTTKADEGTIVAVGAGSLKLNPSAAWDIKQIYGAAQNWAYYPNNDFSLQTDIFQLWFYFDNFGASQPGTWMEIDIDLHDGSFKKDWYSFSIGFLNSSSANPHVRHNVNYDVSFQVGQWQQITWAKSQFFRNGGNLELDWSMVQAIRFKGGNFTGNLYLDNFTLSGGSAMGAGPAAGNGGSEYDYYAVFRNLLTGSQSNPNSDAVKLFAVSDNKVMLSNIPVSSDPQVGARDLYRTSALNQAGGGDAFFLDTIYDNVTTSYLDAIADTPLPLVTTPWRPNIAVPPSTPTHISTANYFIDAGNGYYFKLIVAGTTGAAPPQWSIPSSQWVARGAFLLNETASPSRANGHFWQVTSAGISGLVEPDWTQPGPLIDGTVTWTDQGVKNTTDKTAVWQFQGINATRTLGSDALLFDNAPPQSSYGDAFGPFEGGMLWTRDSAAGASGYVYASPPGRPESVAISYLVSSSNDPMQKVIAWDGTVWAFSTARAFKAAGSSGASLGVDLATALENLTSPTSGIIFSAVDDALGTNAPFTVQAVQLIGIIYWAPDGIRVLNWSGSRLIGFEQLAPIFRGQPEEDVPSWNQSTGPIWAAHGRNEIIFSDSAAMTLALLYDGLMGGEPAWRLPGRILTAAYYEHQTGELAAAFGGSVYLFEHPGQVTDG